MWVKEEGNIKLIKWHTDSAEEGRCGPAVARLLQVCAYATKNNAPWFFSSFKESSRVGLLLETFDQSLPGVLCSVAGDLVKDLDWQSVDPDESVRCPMIELIAVRVCRES